MKILVLARWPVGGIRTFLRYMYSNLDDKSQSVRFVLPEGDNNEVKVLRGELSSEVVSFNILPSKITLLNYARNIWRERRTADWDLVHVNGLLTLIATMPLLFFCRIPIVVTLHDMFLPGLLGGFSGRAKRQILQLCFKRVSAIHFVSEDSRSNFSAEVGRIGDNVRQVVIRNGIEIVGFTKAETRNIRDELLLEDNAFLIGFLGRFMAPKGFSTLLDAVAPIVGQLLSDRPWYVITFGDGGFIREDMEKVSRLRANRHFKNLPLVPHIGSSLKGIDVVAIPSKWETCPLLPMEAMTAGVPVVASDCVGLREVIKDTPVQTIPVGDGVALREALERVASGTESLEAARNFARVASMRFDVRQARSEFYELLSAIHTEVGQDR